MIKINFVPFEEFNLDNHKLMYVLRRLSDATKAEENTYLLPREVDFYLKNSLCIVFALDQGNFVGAASVIPCLDNRTEEKMWDDKLRLITELGSNYVTPQYRGNKIGKEFMLIRLDYCENKNHFPVSVTGNEAIQNHFEKMGGVLLKEYPRYKDLYPRIRTCNCPKGQLVHNKECSLLDKEVYGFKKFI